MENSKLPTKGKLYLVETENEVFWSERKLDAAYKHVEFRYGRAVYKEVNAARYYMDRSKRYIPLAQEPEVTV